MVKLARHKLDRVWELFLLAEIVFEENLREGIVEIVSF